MKIGVDISQLAFPNTGVANYLMQLVEELTKQDIKNEYILFFSSLRGKLPLQFEQEISARKNVSLKKFRMPPSVLDTLWNKIHKLSIESFIGDIDVFISSDWTEPPVKKAKKVTIFYDFIVYKYPEETHSQTEFKLLKRTISPNIVATQKRKHKWAKKECSSFLCISEATKKDAIDILGIDEKKISVIYPGVTL